MKLYIPLLFIFLFAVSTNAGPLKFILIPKEGPSPYFLQCRDGAMAAAKAIGGIDCIYKGPEETSVRIQNQIVEDSIRQGADGIALAVTQSKFLAENSMKAAQKAGIPVITFDADFDRQELEADPGLRLAYIGTDNYEFGRALGRGLKKVRPQGGRICIQSGRENSPNLDLRIMGFRAELAGENNWTEISRSPLYSWDRRDHALSQLTYVLGSGQVDAFVAMGGWPQYADGYRENIRPFMSKITQGQIALVIGDTTPPQMALLKEGLGQLNIGQRPYEMGKIAIQTLHKIVKGEPHEKIIHTPLTRCTPENYQTCTQPL